MPTRSMILVIIVVTENISSCLQKAIQRVALSVRIACASIGFILIVSHHLSDAALFALRLLLARIESHSSQVARKLSPPPCCCLRALVAGCLFRTQLEHVQPTRCNHELRS